MSSKLISVTEGKEFKSNLAKCGCCGLNHPQITWKPVCEMRITIKGKSVSHFAICPQKQDLVLMTK